MQTEARHIEIQVSRGSEWHRNIGFKPGHDAAALAHWETACKVTRARLRLAEVGGGLKTKVLATKRAGTPRHPN